MPIKFGYLLMLTILFPHNGQASEGEPGPVNYLVRQECAQAARCYESIQAALDAIDERGKDGWARVDVAAGDYF